MIYTNDKEITKELKKILIDKELSLADLARKLDILPQTLNGILNRKKLEFGDIQRICTAIGCELHYSIKESTTTQAEQVTRLQEYHAQLQNTNTTPDD